MRLTNTNTAIQIQPDRTIQSRDMAALVSGLVGRKEGEKEAREGGTTRDLLLTGNRLHASVSCLKINELTVA